VKPQKRAKYSKPLDADEIEEVIMDEESDKELEETERTDGTLCAVFLIPEDEDKTEETEVTFATRRAGVSQTSSILLDLQMAPIDQLPPI